MTTWKFLIQKEDDLAWLPLESPSVEVLEGRYRLIAHTEETGTPVQVHITHRYEHDGVIQEEQNQQIQVVDSQGHLDILPLTYLRTGLWTVKCGSSDTLTSPYAQSSLGQHSIHLQVLAHDNDLIDLGSIEPRCTPSVAQAAQVMLSDKKLAHDYNLVGVAGNLLDRQAQESASMPLVASAANHSAGSQMDASPRAMDSSPNNWVDEASDGTVAHPSPSLPPLPRDVPSLRLQIAPGFITPPEICPPEQSIMAELNELQLPQFKSFKAPYRGRLPGKDAIASEESTTSIEQRVTEPKELIEEEASIEQASQVNIGEAWNVIAQEFESLGLQTHFHQTLSNLASAPDRSETGEEDIEMPDASPFPSVVKEQEIAVAGLESAKPENFELGTSDPEISDVAVPEPEIAKPKVAELKISEPVVLGLAVSEPAVSELEVAEPEILDLKAEDLEVTESAVSGPEITVLDPDMPSPNLQTLASAQVSAPQLLVPSGELIVDAPTPLVVRVSSDWMTAEGYVQVWVRDHHTGDLLAPPQILQDWSFKPEIELYETTTQITVPWGSLAASFVAVAVNPLSQQESPQTVVERFMVPTTPPMS